MATRRARTSQKPRPALKIEFVRSGGFAGIRLARTVDANELGAEQARRLQSLVDEAGFFELPEILPPTRVIPDSMMYQITIAAGNRRALSRSMRRQRPLGCGRCLTTLLNSPNSGAPPRGGLRWRALDCGWVGNQRGE